ncbi:MAG: hypothetical protein ACFFD4_07705 [Candidatus Odinarchaeota archaeon]
MGDLDGIIERNGKFLVIEAKGSYKEVGGGQAKMFDAMVQTGYFTVIVVRGPTNKPREMRTWPSYWIPCNMKIFREAVMKWFVEVEDNAIINQ